MVLRRRVVRARRTRSTYRITARLAQVFSRRPGTRLKHARASGRGGWFRRRSRRSHVVRARRASLLAACRVCLGEPRSLCLDQTRSACTLAAAVSHARPAHLESTGRRSPRPAYARRSLKVLTPQRGHSLGRFVTRLVLALLLTHGARSRQVETRGREQDAGDKRPQAHKHSKQVCSFVPHRAPVLTISSVSREVTLMDI